MQIIKFILLAILLLYTSILNGQSMKIDIIPSPQKILIPDFAENFSIDEYLNITSNHFQNKDVQKSFRLLENELNSLLGTNISKKDGCLIELNLIDDFLMEDEISTLNDDEAYILDINQNHIVISAKNPKGLFYGSQSLIQLAEHNKGILPIGKIIDWPDLKYRGISDDISRGQVSTLENFKRILSFLARHKMNTYMPYIEDMIEFDAFPSIGKNRGALTKKEIKEIVEFADQNFIEVIPIFQTLGHFENILSQKEFIKFADFPGAASLDVTNNETYEFLETLLKEVFELFPSQYFHIGADESYDVGFGNSRKLVDETDIASVHAGHYKKVYDICSRNNKKVMMYGDIILSHPKILEEIPKDIVIVDWQYFPRFDYPSAKTFEEAGFEYIVSPSVWNFNAAFPENFFAVPNIQLFTKAGIDNNSIGMINSCWGDYGSETFKKLNLYGYAWSAQCSWNIEDSNLDSFEDSFFLDFYGINNEELKLAYKNLSDPENQVLWNDFWRHPLFDFRNHDWRTHNFSYPSKILWMNYSNENFDFNKMKKDVTKNKDHIELIEYTYRLKEYFQFKLQTQQRLYRMLNYDKYKDTLLIKDIKKNIDSLVVLKNEFPVLWEKYNKEENLWMVLDKFNRLIDSYGEIYEDLKRNSLKPIAITSKCIFHNSEEDSVTEHAKFKSLFKINGKINSAHIQFLAEGHAKVFINDKYVDEVYVKRSGSIWVEQQRIKLVDVSKFLKEGENEIFVTVDNFKNKNACLNLIGQIITENDNIFLMTDSSWISSNAEEDLWQNASESKTTLDITSPNFNTLRKSWIER